MTADPERTESTRRLADPLAMDTTPAPDKGGGGDSLWKMVDDRLRGRWKPMLVAACMIGAVFAAVGWWSTGPRYESTGVLRITPNVPVIIEKTPESEIDNFSMFVQTQVKLLKSRRVLENAIQDPTLAELDYMKGDDLLLKLEEDLEVNSDRNTELIYVTYECREPLASQAIVNAVIKSYDEIYGQAGGHQVGRTLERLRELQTQQNRRIQRIDSDIRGIYARYDGTDPEQLEQVLLQRLQEVDEQRFIAERALAGAGPERGSQDTSGGPNAPLLMRLESIDPQLTVVRQGMERARSNWELIQQNYREGTRAWRRAESEFNSATRLFEEEYARAMATWDQVRIEEPGVISDGMYDGLPRELLVRDITALQEQHETLQSRMLALTSDIELLRDFRDEEARVKGELDRIGARISGLKLTEENIAARISIEQKGFRPISPSRDGRPKRAAAGLLGGACLSFGLFFLLGTIDRRAFGARQLGHVGDDSTLPMLGVVPDLGRSMLDPEASDTAAHCVHQIRNQIEALRAPHSGYVLALSSPFQGDGKTSIVLSLSWSYAMAGNRVLVVDCDLVGRSMTRQTGLSGREGLKEALGSPAPNAYVSTLDVENLSFLPVGVDPNIGPEAIRRPDLVALFDGLRDHYDIILVDTGPILGSLESMPVVSSADGLVLSVRRGRSRTRVQDAVSRILSLGANCLGVVLNCADRNDCYRYVSETSLEPPGRDTQPGLRRTVSSGKTILSRPGGLENPLVLAMEMTTTAGEDEMIDVNDGTVTRIVAQDPEIRRAS